MSIENLVTIVQQILAIIIMIVALYFLHKWVASSEDDEGQRKVALDNVRQVRRSAFQKSLAMLRIEDPLDARRSSERVKLEEQNGIK